METSKITSPMSDFVYPQRILGIVVDEEKAQIFTTHHLR